MRAKRAWTALDAALCAAQASKQVPLFIGRLYEHRKDVAVLAPLIRKLRGSGALWLPMSASGRKLERGEMAMAEALVASGALRVLGLESAREEAGRISESGFSITPVWSAGRSDRYLALLFGAEDTEADKRYYVGPFGQTRADEQAMTGLEPCVKRPESFRADGSIEALSLSIGAGLESIRLVESLSIAPADTGGELSGDETASGQSRPGAQDNGSEGDGEESFAQGLERASEQSRNAQPSDALMQALATALDEQDADDELRQCLRGLALQLRSEGHEDRAQ